MVSRLLDVRVRHGVGTDASHGRGCLTVHSSVAILARVCSLGRLPLVGGRWRSVLRLYCGRVRSVVAMSIVESVSVRVLALRGIVVLIVLGGDCLLVVLVKHGS